MLTFDIVTLFPELFNQNLLHLPLSRAINEQFIKVNIHNLRDYAVDKRGSVDDSPFGGGAGMVLRIEPLHDVLKHIYSQYKNLTKASVLVMSPKGEIYNQQKAENLTGLEQITLVCGRYEGIDHRIYNLNDILNIKNLTIEPVSIGKYVLSGGELAANVVLESTTRILPGFMQNPDTLVSESYNDSETIEYPQYTRPENFNGLTVPKILLSGDHKKIKLWRENQST